MLKITLKRIYNLLKANAHICNICGHTCNEFESNEWHKYIICPNCKSQVRHRLLVAALTYVEPYKTEGIPRGRSVLHFAPEKFLRTFFTEHCHRYTTADLLAPGYSYEGIDLKIDISNMKEVNDKSYDICIAIDVLEHVPDHISAMKELFRILKPDGYAILSVPQKNYLEKTIDDPDITDPEERLKNYGQKDHLRIYGFDFRDMLVSAGFKVNIVDENSFEKKISDKYVLYPPVLSDRKFVTNFRKIYFGKR